MDNFSPIGADADAVAALALVRALIRVLQDDGKISSDDVRKVLDNAANQMAQGGPGRKFIGGQAIVANMRPQA